MLKVGLTGNIASGKSAVARTWRDLGARVVDADELARRAVAAGSPGLARIVERWGTNVLDAEGRLNRAALREIVFADPGERAALEAITHPEVARLRDEAHRAAEREGIPLVVSDIPLLYEVGLEKEFDRVVLVHAPDEVRRRRLVELRGLAPEAADRMMAAQMPADEKLARADVVIRNDASLEALRARAREVWRELSAEAGSA